MVFDPEHGFYGTRRRLGPYRGGGVILGSTSDPWQQAIDLARDGHLKWAALQPGTPLEIANELSDKKIHVMVWQSPELAHLDPASLIMQYKAVGHMGQAESVEESAVAVANGHSIHLHAAKAIICGGYGLFHLWPQDFIAVPEIYTNADPNADPAYIVGMFGAGAGQNPGLNASAVSPCVGGWSNDNDAPKRYKELEPFTRLLSSCIYAGEDLITSEVLNVMVPMWEKQWLRNPRRGRA